MKLRLFIVLLLFPVLLPSAIANPTTGVHQSILFQRTWGGAYIDRGWGVAVDSSGSVYVTGDTYSFSAGSPNQNDVILLKYNSTGGLIWARTWGGNGTDLAYSVVVDRLGNVYVTGYTSSFGAGGSSCVPSPCRNAFLLKFDSSGSLLWQKTWGGSRTDIGRGIALDLSGNVYIAGRTESFGAGSSDALILKVDPSGSLLWQKTWGGGGFDVARGVAVDSSGDIYLTGHTNSFGAGGTCLGGACYDTFLLKLDSGGNLLWQRTWGGAGFEHGRGVALDSSGNVYVAGRTESFGAGSSDALLLKFDYLGNLVWQRTWGGSGYEEAWGIAVDPSNKIYITGQTDSFGGGSDDVFLLNFDSSGNLLSQQIWGGIGDDDGLAVAVDAGGDAFVSGYVNESTPHSISTPGNSTLGLPTFIAGVTGNSTLGTPTFALRSPSGIIETPSGRQTYAGNLDSFVFKYGPLPIVTFQTNPPEGSITFNGTTYTNNQNGTYTYGSALATAGPLPGYTFTQWTATGAITVTYPNRNPTIVTVTGTGTLAADFTPDAPLNPTFLILPILLTTAVVLTAFGLYKRWRKHARSTPLLPP